MELTRRGFLTAALAVGLAGCVPVPDPRMSTSTTPWPRPDVWGEAAANEIALASLYAEVADVIPGGATWCRASATLHAVHATCLNQPDPWGGYQAGDVPTTGLDIPAGASAALASLQQAVKQASTSAQDGLSQASAGPEALLWSSLLVCLAVDAAWCTKPSAGRPAPLMGSAVPSRGDLGTSGDAAAAALDGVNALIYALGTALGRTPRSGQLYASTSKRLATMQTLRYQLQTLISAGGGTVEPSQLTYDLPYGLGSPAAIQKTWDTLEGNLALPLTRLAGLQGGSAGLKTATMAGTQLAKANSLGQTYTWWPGWG